jgi:HEAT repeat protein
LQIKEKEMICASTSLVSVRIDDKLKAEATAARALRELRDEAAVNGTSEMSLDEINAEISAVRNGGYSTAE